jgi:hypothetical protein
MVLYAFIHRKKMAPGLSIPVLYITIAIGALFIFKPYNPFRADSAHVQHTASDFE